MTVLLCDVGGTHIRFALARDNPLHPYKTRVDQYKNLSDAIAAFLRQTSVSADDISAFYLSFSNRNEWNTHPDDLRGVLPKASVRQVNDFEANAYGVIQSVPSDFQRLNVPSGAHVADAAKAVIGVGTGLGLAYICGGAGRTVVRRTHGGHMLPAYSPAHHDLYSFLQKQKTDALIYEDMLSGRGLYDIYRFLSERNHLFAEYPDAAILMRDAKDNPVFRESLVIFFEILGLFAHQAVAFGYAYAGIYLTGGIIDRLMAANLFAVDPFMTYFKQKNVKIVADDVNAIPVYWIKDEFVSLNGLKRLSMGHDDA